MADVDLTLLTKLAEQTLSEVRQLRKEVADVRTHTLQTSDYSRRMERRVNELKDDLELMLKSELMGQLTHVETRIEASIDNLSDRVSAIEAR
jgi:phage shock protein A